MSTRSSIAILNLDGTVHGHYCHSDGYLGWNGAMLYEHYRDVNKVKELVDLGDMSVLYPNVNPQGKDHSFDNPEDGVCIFYGRDRSEDNVETQKYSSLEHYLKEGNFQEYDYVFHEKRNAWYLIDHDKGKLVRLEGLLKKDKHVATYIKEMIDNEKAVKTQARKLTKELPEKVGKTQKVKV